MIRVTCAIIRNEEDEILVVRRGGDSDHPFKWEFPGGKVDDGESDEDCILREIREELSLDIVIFSRLPEVDHDYGSKHILLIPFICDTLDVIPELSEHVAYEWIKEDKLMEKDFQEADISVAHLYLQLISYREGSSHTAILKEESFSEDKGMVEMINNIHSTKEVDWVAASATENPEILRKIIEYSTSNNRKLASHSAWTVSKVADKNPELLEPFLNTLIQFLPQSDNESAERSVLRVISLSNVSGVNSKYQGLLADHCFNRLRSRPAPIAVKAYAMEILFKLTNIYPELANELVASILILKETEKTAGILARGRIIMKKLAGITSSDF